MDAQLKTRLAIQIVEATIREVGGHFPKGHHLKMFYQKMRSGCPRAFVVLRPDADDFVGLLVTDEDTRLHVELWVDIENRDSGPLWTQALAQQFRSNALRFSYRSPHDPRALARSMGILDRFDDPGT